MTLLLWMSSLLGNGSPSLWVMPQYCSLPSTEGHAPELLQSLPLALQVFRPGHLRIHQRPDRGVQPPADPVAGSSPLVPLVARVTRDGSHLGFWL